MDISNLVKLCECDCALHRWVDGKLTSLSFNEVRKNKDKWIEEFKEKNKCLDNDRALKRYVDDIERTLDKCKCEEIIDGNSWFDLYDNKEFKGIAKTDHIAHKWVKEDIRNRYSLPRNRDNREDISSWI